jgi:toxin ParE1/3/4
MKTFIISPRAAADINDIYDYTEERWGQDQAEAYTLGIRQALQEVCRGNRAGKPIGHIKQKAISLSYRSHYIVYRQEFRSIVVIRILHRRMNIGRHL